MSQNHRQFFNQAHFVISAGKCSQLTEDTGHEVAFVGRSNAGKSSSINAITDRKGLAKTSKTPGRTQTINVFDLTETQRLIDLPGYGYAKASKASRRTWGALIEEYIHSRESLSAFVLLMDIRHPLQSNDLNLVEWLKHQQLPTLILLTKADKLSNNQIFKQVALVKKAFKQNQDLFTILPFSATSKRGVEEAQSYIFQHLRG